MAVYLTEYFQEQRRIYEQVFPTASMAPNEDSSTDKNKLAAAILMSTNGAFCTPRSVTRSFTSRRKPTADKIIDEMKGLAELL